MNEKQTKFINALFGEARGDLKKAKEIAEYADSYAISQIVKGLEKEIEDRTRSFIAINGPKAAFSMMDILDKPGELGNNIKMSAAKDVLDRAGFSKTDKIEVKTESPLFILPEKRSNEEDVDVTLTS